MRKIFFLFTTTSLSCVIFAAMKKLFVFLLFTMLGFAASAQCAMCTKTAMQLGEKPAEGLNSAILYLMIAPFAIVGYIAFRWYKNEKARDNTAF